MLKLITPSILENVGSFSGGGLGMVLVRDHDSDMSFVSFDGRPRMVDGNLLTRTIFLSISRSMHLGGVRHLMPEDYFMIFTYVRGGFLWPWIFLQRS